MSTPPKRFAPPPQGGEPDGPAKPDPWAPLGVTGRMPPQPGARPANSTLKHPGWAGALAALIEARAGQPFAWGPNDCAAFVADAALAETGADVLAELRAPRRSEREALRQIRAHGGLRAVLARAGLQPVQPALAQRGDVVMVAQGAHEVLAVCMGEAAVAPGPAGLESAPMAQAVAAWRL